jgi:H+/gluconate symporter-like permease
MSQGLGGRRNVTAFEQTLTALMLLAFVAAAWLLVAAARMRAEDAGSRFVRGWTGTFGLLLGLPSGAALGLTLAEHGAGSTLGLAAAVALNAMLQPVCLLFCWAALRKIAIGMGGGVALGPRRATMAELAGLGPSERRQLVVMCVLQGLVVLPLGAGLSFAVAAPLVWQLCR